MPLEFTKGLPDTEDRVAIAKIGPEDDATRKKFVEGSVWVVHLSEWDIRERCQVVVLQRVDGQTS